MSRRQNDHLPISDILKSFVETNKLEHGLNDVQVREAWVELMGSGVNNYTDKVYLQGSKLFVNLSSSVLREELSYGKDKICKMLNEHLGKTVVTEVILK